MTRRILAALGVAALATTIAAAPASAASTSCGGGTNSAGSSWHCTGATPDRSNSVFHQGTPTRKPVGGYPKGTVIVECQSAVICTIVSSFPQRRLVVIGDLASPYPGPSYLPTPEQVREGQVRKGQAAPDSLLRRGLTETVQGGLEPRWVPISYLLHH